MEVACDVGALRRALLNLVQNAIQATPPGGSISLLLERDARRVRIVVADTGKGIPADKLVEVRKPFVTTREKGTGLGLAIVEKIARGHGGTLRIDSEPEHGTRVAIELPIEAE